MVGHFALRESASSHFEHENQPTEINTRLAAIILQAIAQLKLTFTDVHNIPATLFAQLVRDPC
jgi:hypothetical protein